MARKQTSRERERERDVIVHLLSQVTICFAWTAEFARLSDEEMDVIRD